MLVYSYHTIQSATTGSYKEKGSKFLAFAYPVETEEDVRQKLDQLKKEYFDARHHCYAWMLGPERKHFRANDDGEPNHSAGDPILGQIRSKNITNVLVVVVRYFGGVKLGVGGLIAAYKAAAEEALASAVVMEKVVKSSFRLYYAYAETPEVMRLVKEFDITMVDQQFNDDCLLHGEVSLKRKTELVEKVALLKAMGFSVRLAMA